MQVARRTKGAVALLPSVARRGQPRCRRIPRLSIGGPRNAHAGERRVDAMGHRAKPYVSAVDSRQAAQDPTASRGCRCSIVRKREVTRRARYPAAKKREVARGAGDSEARKRTPPRRGSDFLARERMPISRAPDFAARERSPARSARDPMAPGLAPVQRASDSEARTQTPVPWAPDSAARKTPGRTKGERSRDVKRRARATRLPEKDESIARWGAG